VPQSSGEGLAVIYDTSATGYSPIASGNTNQQSTHFDLRYAQTVSIQIVTDGGAKVNWQYQVTNLPINIANYGRTVLGSPSRDDTFASTQWSTVQSGQLAAGSAQGTILTLSTQVHRAGRVTFAWDVSNTGGSTAKVLAIVRTMGS